MQLSLLYGIVVTAIGAGLEIFDIVKTKQMRQNAGFVNAKVAELHSYNEIKAYNLPYQFGFVEQHIFDIAAAQPDGDQALDLKCWPVYEVEEKGRTRQIYGTNRSYAPQGAIETICIDDKGINNQGVAGWHSIAMLILSGGVSVLISYILWLAIFGTEHWFFREYAGGFQLFIFAIGINFLITLIWWLLKSTNSEKGDAIKAEVIRWDIELHTHYEEGHDPYIEYRPIPIIAYQKEGQYFYRVAPDIGAVQPDDKYVMINDPGRSTGSFHMQNPIGMVIAIAMMLFFGLCPLFMS